MNKSIQINEDQFFFNVTEVYSVQQGVCYTFSSNLSLSITHMYALSIILKEDISNQKLKLQVVSDEDVNGILMNLWRTQPMKFQDIAFDTKVTVMIDLHETIKEKLTNCNPNGVRGSFYTCLTKQIEGLIDSSNCSKKCKPMLLKSYFDSTLSNRSKIPECENLKDERCMFNEAQTISPIISKCKGQCSTHEYTGKISTTSQVMTDFGENIGHKVDLLFQSTGRSRTLVKEYKVYDTAGLIGTLGGSLGLFLGFSFFGVVSGVLDRLWEKFSQKVVSTSNPGDGADRWRWESITGKAE